MMRSLYSGVSGLKAHQTKMDVIGNNIANVNTVGYKSQSVAFSDLFYQTTQTATGANEVTGTGGQNAKQIGLGAQLNAISVNITGEGGTQSTGNGFDIKINGSSFFVVEQGGTKLFTKAGNFTTDSTGNLVTQSGAYVMGYTAERNELGDFVLQKDQLRPISAYGAKYMTTSPSQTERASFTGNINASDEEFTDAGSGQITRMINVYDNLGNLYSIQMEVTRTSSTEFTLKSTGKVFSGNDELPADELTAAGEITLEFDPENGVIVGEEQFDITMSGSSAAPFVTDITVDVSALTCYGSESTIDSIRGIDGNGGGKPVGNMTSVGVDTNGNLVAAYDNGDNVVIGQIAVATFTNPSGLEKAGNNMFAATLNSGEFNGIGNSIADLGEDMSTGVIEMSNVDLAAEFTDMIVTQRGFQANSRVITTSDTMIEELLSLKR